MSNGTFDFIGDVYSQVYVTPQPKSYYDINQGRGRGWLNQQIIDWMNPNVNFANYDNDNDGDVDMIIFIYRNWDSQTFNGEPFQGKADLGFTGSITRDGKSILGGFPGSGTSQDDVYTVGDFWNIGIHEISHYQFGAGHFDYIGKFGVHDGNSGGSTMSGYERFLLGWINPALISSNTSITLTDAATTSSYCRINVPNSDEYFLLENRQALSVYEQADFCLHTALPATGLMISHIRPSVAKIDQLRWEAADNTFLITEEGQSSDSYKPGNKVQFTPWTRPNSDRSNGAFTGIAVTNINQSGNNITADIVINFSSGTLTENSWWEVSESIGGNVTLISGKTLTVTPNTTVTFSSGATVTINGSLVANSTISGQRITFSSATTTPGFWNGITINSGSSTNVSTLRRCDVQYATDGIKISYTGNTNNVTIDKCKIQNNSAFGINVAGNGSGASAHPRISSSTVANNNNSGIYLTNYAKPTITGNRIENNGYAGIEGTSNNSDTLTYNYIAGNLDYGVRFSYSSFVELHRNTIKSNYGTGVFCFSNSNLNANGTNTDTTKGRNEISWNSGVGIYASSSSPNFGQDVTSQYGNNWIHDNTSYEAQQVGAGYQFAAKRNYWSGQQSNVSGNVTTTPVLSSQPSPVGWGKSSTYDPTFRIGTPPANIATLIPEHIQYTMAASTIMAKTAATNTATTNWTTDLRAAIALGLTTGDWSAAGELIAALHRELQEARVPDVDFALVDTYANDLAVAAFIRKMLALVLMEKDLVDSNTSAALAKLTAFRRSNLENAAELLANAGLIHLYRQNDLAAAQNVLAQMQTLAQSGDVIAAEHVKVFGRILQDYQDHQANTDLAKPVVAPSQALAKLPANPALAQNYPNPFNPETAIRFHLNERRKMRLLIFDLHGKLVRTLIDGELPIGEHTISWDGRNQIGQAAASGVYYYELVAGNKVERKKMTLVR